MKLLNSILVAVDFRSGVAPVLLTASKLADQFASQIHLLHVLPTTGEESPEADLDTHFRRGTELLQKGFPEEARREFQHCVGMNGLFAPAWEGLADSYRRLGDMPRAEASQRTAKQVKDQLNVQQVEVSIRRRHPFWRNSLPRR